jgi:uncharacterized tellurite resistance protein B-like protein
MLRFFDQLLAGTPEPEVDDDEKLRLAATALLFRALYVDGHPDSREEESIRRIVTTEFGLEETEVEKLLDASQKAAVDATDLYGWTRLINAEYTYDEKCYLMEKLWQVVLADEVVDDHESALMRRLSGLIHVTDADNAKARQRATADT